jgi:hypothetical protein
MKLSELNSDILAARVLDERNQWHLEDTILKRFTISDRGARYLEPWERKLENTGVVIFWHYLQRKRMNRETLKDGIEVH